MMHQTYADRRIIWESKSARISLICICFQFVIMSAIVAEELLSSATFWVVLVFLGGGGLRLLYQLLHPKNLFVDPDSELGKQIKETQYKAALEWIVYREGGFMLADDSADSSQPYNWRDLEAAFAYKIDMYTTDAVCLDLFWDDGRRLSLSEEMPCWQNFMLALEKNMPAIPQSWYLKITVPVFETSFTVLFDKQNRSQEEVQKSYYV